MALTEAQSKNVYNVIDNAVVAILKAESSVTDVIGNSIRKQNEKTIEAKLRNKPRDFANVELPALTVMSISGADADAETEGALREIEKTVPVQIFVMTRGSDLGDTVVRCKEVAAIVEHFLRKQIHSSSELEVELATPGNDANVFLKNVSTTFSPTGTGQSRFEVVGVMTFDVLVDICVNLP